MTWKPHIAGIFAALTTLTGLATAISQIPGLTDTKVGKAAVAVVAIGSACQAFTKGVQHGDTDVVPKVGL